MIIFTPKIFRIINLVTPSTIRFISQKKFPTQLLVCVCMDIEDMQRPLIKTAQLQEVKVNQNNCKIIKVINEILQTLVKITKRRSNKIKMS